jgi:hypothetical protein
LESHTNKKTLLALPRGNLKQKSDDLHKGEVVITPENKATAGSDSNKEILPDFTQIPNDAAQTPENREASGSGINREQKLDLPASNLKQKRNKPSKEEVMPIPNKVVRSILLQSLFFVHTHFCVLVLISLQSFSIFRNHLLLQGNWDVLGQRVNGSAICAR